MGSDPFLGEICMFAGTFAPQGWALCNGQLLSIAHNSALFSILGTTYGGDGVTTFALPDLQGRVPIHPGSSKGWQLGQSGGASSVTLTQANLAAHTHMLQVSSAAGDRASPEGCVLAGYGSEDLSSGPYSSGLPDSTMSAVAVSSMGSHDPVEVQNPYLCVNFIISLEGFYPSRS